MDAMLPTISGRKRCLSEADDALLTPKKARAQAAVTPSKSRGRTSVVLPSVLARVAAAHSSLEEALIPALATSNSSAPVPDKSDLTKLNMPNIIPQVLVAGLSLDNLKSLVWILEWDGESIDPSSAQGSSVDSDNPFLVPSTPSSKNWIRGGHGIIITPTTHLNRTTSRRSQVYGLGIQVQRRPSDRSSFGGVNVVTRWIEGADQRKALVQERLQQWAELHRKASREQKRSKSARSSSPTPLAIPPIPVASLPALSVPASPVKSPVKGLPLIMRTPSKPSGGKSTISFPTPSSSSSSYSTAAESLPSTPSKSSTYGTPSRTPSTARRDAVFERLRQRSITNGLDGTPTKGAVSVTLGKDEDGNVRTKTVSSEELKRRALLSKLDGVAECVSLLFATDRGAASVMSPQKRRIMRQDEVVRVVVKSSKSPLSDAEANESLSMLLGLCPTFLVPRIIDRETWLEMPSALSSLSSALQKSPTKARRLPPSPSAFKQSDLEEELLSRKPGEGSPKRARVADTQYGHAGKDFMTLRDVRETIRRELEKV